MILDITSNTYLHFLHKQFEIEYLNFLISTGEKSEEVTFKDFLVTYTPSA